MSAASIIGAPPHLQRPKPSDWRDVDRREALTEFQKSILEADWDSTPLGPITRWANQLTQLVWLVISDPSPAAACWYTGSESTIIGNEAFENILDPKSLANEVQGLDLARDWCEMETIMQRQREEASVIVLPQRTVLLRRIDTIEEAHITWRFTPQRSDDGMFVGSHLTGADVTSGSIAARRLKAINVLSQAISTASSTTELWSQLLRGLKASINDIPMASLYSVNHSTSGSRSLPAAERPRFSTQPLTCTLEGTVGEQANRLELPSCFHLTQDESWIAKSFVKAIETGDLVHLTQKEGTMPPMLRENHQRDQDSPWSRMIVCPLRSGSLGPVSAFLLLAIPIWRPYDRDYESFVDTLVSQAGPSQIAAMVVNDRNQKLGISMEQEISEKARLALELKTRTLEVEEGEKKLARFTARAQVALGVLDGNGSVMFANPLWRELTQLEPADDQVAWAKAIIPDDLPETYAVFARLISDRCPIDFHLRFNKRWESPKLDKDGVPITTDTHIICNLFPDLDDEGNVTSIMSCLTDISE